jgi:large subunit ribosomal protein L6
LKFGNKNIMSRIGKKPIELNDKITDSEVIVKGPLGELKTTYKPVVEIKQEDNQIIVTPKNDDLATTALWGTYTSIIGNLVQGVNEEYEKNLIIEGVGFRAEVKGDKLVLNIGFSHPVELDIPQGITVTVEKEKINVKGIDKQAVGEFTAVIRSNKKPEPYKGKGIRYADEIIRRKEGKKTV